MKEYLNFDYRPKHVVPESVVKEVRSIVRSCILTRKGGMPVSDLRDEYKSITDEDIPYYELGYNSLFHFLRDMPDIKSARNENGHVLIVEANEKNKHLIDMIKNQKDPRTNRRPVRKVDRNREKIVHARQNMYDERRNQKPKIEEEKTTEDIEPPEDENTHRPHIITDFNFDFDTTICNEPVIGTTQLIGDDYFLQLCIKYSNYELKRKTVKSAITCGTVQSGLTIKKAIRKLDDIAIISNKLVINLGTVDIYNRHTEEEMVKDYTLLLNKIRNKYCHSANQITLCTLPPMGNVGMFAEPEKYMNYVSFNSWLRNFAQNNNYKLLDFHHEFTDVNRVMNYQFFQQNARMVSGTSHPHVLWNYFGRQRAMKLLLNLK